MEHERHCKDLLAALSDYIDGELAGELCIELERHLSECENCRIVVDTLRKTIYLVRVNTEPASTPEGVRQRLYHSLSLDDQLS